MSRLACTERASRLPIALIPDVVNWDALPVRLDAINAGCSLGGDREASNTPFEPSAPPPHARLLSPCSEANTPESGAITPRPSQPGRSSSRTNGCGNPSRVCEVRSILIRSAGVLAPRPIAHAALCRPRSAAWLDIVGDAMAYHRTSDVAASWMVQNRCCSPA